MTFHFRRVLRDNINEITRRVTNNKNNLRNVYIETIYMALTFFFFRIIETGNFFIRNNKR